MKNGEVHPDENCKRIEWLISNILRKVGNSKKYGAWETLYLDPNDNRYWVKTHHRSDYHGGGPPKLKNIDFQEAIAKFKFDKKLTGE